MFAVFGVAQPTRKKPTAKAQRVRRKTRRTAGEIFFAAVLRVLRTFAVGFWSVINLSHPHHYLPRVAAQSRARDRARDRSSRTQPLLRRTATCCDRSRDGSY